MLIEDLLVSNRVQVDTESVGASCAIDEVEFSLVSPILQTFVNERKAMDTAR